MQKKSPADLRGSAPQTGHNSNHLVEQLKLLNEL